MEFVINPNIPSGLVECARKIAVTRGYPVLIRGLQPAEDYEIEGVLQRGLISKRDIEFFDLRNAIAEGKERIWWLYEAADVLYYSACLDEVKPDSARPYGWFVDALSTLYTYGIDQEEAEPAALAKYQLRASLPYRKDQETPEERRMRDEQEHAAIEEAIQRALETVPWPGVPVQELAEKWDIPVQTLYKAINSKHIPARQAGSSKSVILVNDRSSKWREWLKGYLDKKGREY